MILLDSGQADYAQHKAEKAQRQYIDSRFRQLEEKLDGLITINKGLMDAIHNLKTENRCQT